MNNIRCREVADRLQITAIEANMLVSAHNFFINGGFDDQFDEEQLAF